MEYREAGGLQPFHRFDFSSNCTDQNITVTEGVDHSKNVFLLEKKTPKLIGWSRIMVKMFSLLKNSMLQERLQELFHAWCVSLFLI